MTKQQWDLKISEFGKKLFSLYWEDNLLSLKRLNELREIIKEMDQIMQGLFRIRKFPLLYSAKRANTDKLIFQMSNQFMALEYNLTLCIN